MTPAGVLAAIEKIKCPRSPNEMRKHFSQIKVLSNFAKLDARKAPIEASFAYIADQTGMSTNTVRGTIEELVKGHVLKRTAGAGQRAHWYEIETDIHRWRCFDWQRPVSFVATEVAIANGELRPVASGKPSSSINAYAARQRGLVARRMHVPVENDLSRSACADTQTEPLSRSACADDDFRGSSLSTTVSASPTSLTQGDRELIDKVGALVVREFRGKFIKGGPLNGLTSLVVQGATEAELLDLIASCPRDGMQVPSAVNWMLQQWAVRDVVIHLPEPAPAAPRPSSLESTLRAMELAGEGDTDEAEELRRELQVMEA